MPCFPGERIPFGSSASLIVSAKRLYAWSLKLYCSVARSMKSRWARYSPYPSFAASLHEQPARVVRAPRLGLVLRVEDDHRHVDEAAGVGGDEDGGVVEPRLALDEPAEQVAQSDGVRAR